jgi:hypothetical protein
MGGVELRWNHRHALKNFTFSPKLGGSTHLGSLWCFKLNSG